MATGGGDFQQPELLAKLSCSVCLEIFEDPTSIPCGHTFCSHCLDSAENLSGSSSCPLCRAGYNPRRKIKAFNIQQQILQSSVSCPDCKRQLRMSSLKSHKALCTKVTIPSVAPVSKLWPNMKNRSTFSCPYCHQPNLDSDGLLKHVNNNHRHEVKPVVCPICASMPWGNANQKSGNFVHHLNLRHKFEYSTFVDFEQDEEDVLKQVLSQSLEDH